MKNNEKKKFNPFKSVAVCLCSLMFVASFALFAVSLALSLVDITAGGHISFTASGVYATVTGTVTGTKTTNTLDTLNFDATTENSFTTPDSWKNMTFDFTSDNLITFTVNFQNLSTENPLYVSFTDGLTVTNVTTTRTLDGLAVTTFPTLEVPASTTKTAVVTFKVDDIYKSVSSDFSLGMELIDKTTIQDESVYTGFSFTPNSESLKTVSAVCSSSSSADFYTLEIPKYVLINGEMYIVTDLYAGVDIDYQNFTIPSTIVTINLVESGSTFVCANFNFKVKTGWSIKVEKFTNEELTQTTTYTINLNENQLSGYNFKETVKSLAGEEVINEIGMITTGLWLVRN